MDTATDSGKHLRNYSAVSLSETEHYSHEAVHETGKFLIEIMPLMFIPAAVGLLETWDVIAPAWLEYVAVTVISTWVVMIVSGRVTQFVIRRKRKDVQESHV